MAEATCRRELELEIPAEDVQKAMEKIAKEFARIARVPGFRPGKAPVTLIRRRFADDIKSEVLQSLVPERIEQAVNEQKLTPITQPHVHQVDFPEAGPVKFRAVFEVLPEFELGEYKGVEVTIEDVDIGDADVDRTLDEMRDRAATLAPVEGRAVEDGDYAELKLVGTPEGGSAEPIQADNVLCHIGAEETIDAFNENLRGAKIGDHKRFEVRYPDDYPDPKLGGKAYTYAVEVLGIKVKKLPELDDDFAKEHGDAATLDELRGKIRQSLEAARDQRRKAQAREKILEEIIKLHDFPVPEALVEHQMDVRLERVVRSLAQQGVDPRAVNVDWVAMRRRQQDRAVADVKAELLLDKIALAEKIDVTDEELSQEIEHLAGHTGEAAEAVRARLTKQGVLDRMKSKLRSDKTLEWLYQNARIQTTSVSKS